MSVNQLVLLCAEVVLSIIAFGLLVLSFVLLVECIAAMLPLACEAFSGNWQNTKIAVLIPAHNEELVIYQTITNLKSALKPQHQVVVIADNCTDATVGIAKSTGAIVIERHDLQRRGKGYALDCGLKFLASDPPEVVVFIDADCQIDKNAIALLSQQAIKSNRPVQAQPTQPQRFDFGFCLQSQKSRSFSRNGTIGHIVLTGWNGNGFPLVGNSFC
jgi:glycosyltransferase involved in cell wall biosynthesis